MSGLLAQSDKSFFDNTWPEEFTFPFGEWIKQLIFWAVNNPVTSTIGEIIEWPFAQMFELIMSERVGRDSIMTIPWIWLVIATFLVASFTRNTRVGVACASMLAVCGFLGAEYWTETSKTIGMILVSVTLCAVVGIPLGILSGRFDGVWNVVRPTLDAMQVVHSFVFMLPFIFFFGIGEVAATMVTMVFALPPLVRLTNLGIRQVPADVVEASRAYGATELRVLTDVQLPLARPAIMTGVNQTLLLAISMLGIAALMGAGGLGRLLFRAINNLNLGLAASGGLAFFLVAVILDRISQTEAQDGISLLTKIRHAWAYRADPEGLLDAQGTTASGAVVAPEPTPDERPSPVGGAERSGLMLAAVGGVIAIVSGFLTWGKNAGLVSGWGRFADEDLAGQSFNGFEASGGTFFGILVMALGALALLAAIRPLVRFGSATSTLLVKAQGLMLAALAGVIGIIFLLNLLDVGFGPLPTIGIAIFCVSIALVAIETFVSGSPRLGADGVLIAGMASAVTALAYLIMRPSIHVADYADGIGVYVALIAGLAMVVGGVMATAAAPYGPRRPLPVDVSWGRIAGASLALLLILGSAFGRGNVETKTEFAWLYDARIEAIERASDEVPPDIEAEIARLKEEAAGDINKQIANAQTITNLINSVKSGNKVVHRGVDAEGPGLGWLAIVLGVAGLAVAVPASGLLGGGDQMRWRASTVLAGLGLSLMALTAALTLGIVRVAESGALAGIGTFMTFIAGFIIFASGRSVVNEFRRRKVYADPTANALKDADITLTMSGDERLDAAATIEETATV